MNSEHLQPYLGIAVSILATQDASATKNLKDFLVSMPSTKQIEQTLGLAIVQLAEQNPAAFKWVLAHQSILMPELDLQAFAEKMAKDRLSERSVSQAWQTLDTVLDQHFSQGERLLIQAVMSSQTATPPTDES